MANSKHAYFRYNLMDDCFRNKSLSKTELLNLINESLEREYNGESIQLRQLDTEDNKVSEIVSIIDRVNHNIG